MKKDDKQIGENIKAIRKANKKTIRDFSDAFYISESSLEKAEYGIRPPTDETIRRISKNTGFSFNMIKYGDLTDLKEGELDLGEEISFSEMCSIMFECYTEYYKYHFPIVASEDALKPDEFREGVIIAREKIQKFNFCKGDCINAINHFIQAEKNESCTDFSAINILSCFGYLYLATVGESVAQIKDNSISSLSDYLITANQNINPNTLIEKKKSFFDKYNSKLTAYMRKLAKSGNNADFAYFYLCMRYRTGMMDESITLMDENQMKMFGESLLDSLWKMGNKYAKALHDFEESS